MKYSSVRIESVGHLLPDRIVTSLELEARLAPCYERLGFHAGRIELMSGICERRHFEPGTRPSSVAIKAAENCLAESAVDREDIGVLVFSSVCRDFMEPASASVVHCGLGLRGNCQLFDLSNACLGFANAMLVVANMIELGQIKAGLIVAGEDGGPLVEATIERLNNDPEVTRKSSKLSFASLTIGSGAAAMVLAHKDHTDSPHELLGGVMMTESSANELCQGGTGESSKGPLMHTDSEKLMQEGVKLGAKVWAATREELNWSNDSVQRVFTHQVGVAHRKLLFEKLELDQGKDFPTVETLGNIGSVSLPISLSLGRDQGVLKAGDNVAMLGIGSGLVCLNLGVRW
ncbi:MAG: 3-oxoacyl-ACP synthase III [Planctomycetes bacterium]|nr:3-oxoacyl-ACP synthase III [Planctomycetota bacterium]